MRATLFYAVLIALPLFQATPAEALQVHLIAGGGERTYDWQKTNRSYGRTALVLETSPTENKTVYGTVLGYTSGHNSFTVGNADYERCYFSLFARTPLIGGQLTVSGGFGPVSGSYSIYGAGGKTNTESFAFSALFSRRISLQGFWLETQTFLLFARVNDYISTANSGAVTHQEDFDRLLGRLQLTVGRDFPMGSVWVRTAFIHDLRGDLKVTQTIGSRHLEHSISLGGSWWRAGIGASCRISSSTSLLVSLDKLWGGNVGADWQFSAGIHITF